MQTHKIHQNNIEMNKIIQKAACSFRKHSRDSVVGGWELTANVLDCDIAISEFELQSQSYVYFWVNSLWKTTDTFILSSYMLPYPIQLLVK